MIKFGCCIPGGAFTPEGASTPVEGEVEALAAKCRFVMSCGFDFTECSGAMLASLPDEDITLLERENRGGALGFYAANSIIPSAYKIADPGDGYGELMDYVRHLIDTLARLGIRYAVFGSGGARAIPDTVDRETGLENLRRFMNDFADYAEPRGVTMVVEPLRVQETNVFHTVPECDEVVRRIDRPGVRLLCDTFHMVAEGTPAEAVEDCGGRISHCHIAESPDRTRPGLLTTGDAAYNRRFAEALLRAGYDGGVSAECIYSDFKTDAPKIFEYLCEIFGRSR